MSNIVLKYPVYKMETESFYGLRYVNRKMETGNFKVYVT